MPRVIFSPASGGNVKDNRLRVVVEEGRVRLGAWLTLNRHRCVYIVVKVKV